MYTANPEYLLDGSEILLVPSTVGKSVMVNTVTRQSPVLGFTVKFVLPLDFRDLELKVVATINSLAVYDFIGNSVLMLMQDLKSVCFDKIVS